MIERVCVIGAGVIGSLFAGHLAQVADVSVLTRRREHADALNREGLRVTGRSDLHANVTASADPDELEPFDLGIVATKATGLEDAASSLEGRFPDATLMTMLNGLGAEDVVRQHGAWQLVGVSGRGDRRVPIAAPGYAQAVAIQRVRVLLPPRQDRHFGDLREVPREQAADDPRPDHAHTLDHSPTCAATAGDDARTRGITAEAKSSWFLIAIQCGAPPAFTVIAISVIPGQTCLVSSIRSTTSSGVPTQT